VHEALAVWRFPQDGLDDWASARARQHGIADPQQLADAARRTRQLLSRFQAHALYQEMDGADRRQHEVPYSRVVAGRVENGIIDALYERDGTWTIVEFKTDKLEDEAELGNLLAEEKYVEQAQRYEAAVEELLGQEPCTILCLLNYARGVRLLDPLKWAEGKGSSTE
jgi:ATP-dependent exoDNAse (exonuclease V) beta subunit